jgi:hypothetical protein
MATLALAYRRVVCVAAWIVVAPGLASAQSRLTAADLTGIVKDPAGGRVQGCTVTVTSLDTNISRTSTSDEAGFYRVPALSPGIYAVTVTRVGFKAQTHERVELLLGRAMTLDFLLQLATTVAEVTVTTEAPIVSGHQLEIGTLITRVQIESLPINGRNFIGPAAISPGVANDRTPLQGTAATTGLSFTGQRARSNNIMVDGLDNNDPVMGAVRATFSQEAVREFQILVDSRNSARHPAVSSTS